jgi:hypothetical protein
MSETKKQQPAAGARVVYRSECGDDYFGAIAAISPAGVATLALDNGMRVSGVEQSDAPDNTLFLNSWNVIEQSPSQTERSDEPGIWLDALCAGLVAALVDAADGHFPLNASGLPAALDSFRRGVGLVLDIKD